VAPKTNIRFSFRIYIGNKAFLGPGRVQLMEGIIHHGSIARAAEAMGMSYRKAWQLVKEINGASRKLLIEKRLGGKDGGGALVTSDGEKAIAKYHALKKKAESFFDDSLNEFEF